MNTLTCFVNNLVCVETRLKKEGYVENFESFVFCFFFF
jgi:hypothetical protein